MPSFPDHRAAADAAIAIVAIPSSLAVAFSVLIVDVREAHMSSHGGDVYAASQRTGIPGELILDFSASVNPLGTPFQAKEAEGRHGAPLSLPGAFFRELAGSIARRLSIAPER